MTSPISSERPRAVLALDVGDARVGAAVSESRVIASTLDAIKRIGRTQTLDAIEGLVRQYKVGTVVLGLPLREDGTEGEQAAKTRAFARSLARRLPEIELLFWDERYSSSEAREILGPRDYAKGRIDSVAAAVILQEYLDAQRQT